MVQKPLPVKLTETQVRERLKTAQFAIKLQLRDRLREQAMLCLHARASLEKEQVGISRKLDAYTALTAEIAELSALVEFIESVYVQKNSKSFSLILHLQEVHAAKMKGLQRELGDLSGRYLKLEGQCLQSHHQHHLVPFGDNERRKLVGEHARLLKDINIVCFIQSFGIVTRRSTGK